MKRLTHINHRNFLACGLLSLFVFLIAGCSGTDSHSSFAREKTQQQDVAQRPTGQSKNTSTVVVKSLRANLRAKPSRSADIVKEVEKGDLLALVNLNPSGPWYRVREDGGTEGWIHGNTIVLIRQNSTRPVTAVDRGTETSRPSPEATKASSGRSYINVDGERVPSPVFSDRPPAGATARCRDGSYSFSRHRRGTCSHHGGVAVWL